MSVVPDPLPPSRPLPPPPRDDHRGKPAAVAPAAQPQRSSQLFKPTDLDALAAQLNELGAAARPNGKLSGPALLPSATNVLDQGAESDSDEEDDGRVRNDGTLLASDPPKPL